MLLFQGRRAHPLCSSAVRDNRLLVGDMPYCLRHVVVVLLYRPGLNVNKPTPQMNYLGGRNRAWVLKAFLMPINGTRVVS